MARKSGSLKTKRTDVPSFWKLPKKKKRFVVTTDPGAHAKKESYPVLVLLRDILGLVKTRREGILVLNQGKIMVDGRAVKSPGFPVGLMDVVEIPSSGKTYRIVPEQGGLLPVEASGDEKSLKICQVRSKRTLRKAVTSYALHDGRVLTPEQKVDMRPGDSCIIKIPSQELQSNFHITTGELALIIRGERSGEVVTVEGLKAGTFSREPIATVRLESGISSEMPTGILLPLGKELPSLTLTKRAA